MTDLPLYLKNSIGDSFEEAASGERSVVTSPADGREIATVPDSGAEDVDRAGSWQVSLRGTTRFSWRCGSSGPQSLPATRSCSSRLPRLRSRPCDLPS